MSKTIKFSDQVWLQELDPSKQYVLMFTGDPEPIEWPDHPDNVGSVIINADTYTLADLEEARRDITERTSLVVSEGGCPVNQVEGDSNE